jgi:hypothetical protein
VRVLLALMLLGLLALLSGQGERGGRRPPESNQHHATRTPAPPSIDRAAIDLQDRTSTTRRRAEARVHDSRPLLTMLPARRAGVRVDIGGLAPDGRTTVLAIDPGSRSRAHARRVLAALLDRTQDRGDGYRLEWAR